MLCYICLFGTWLIAFFCIQMVGTQNATPGVPSSKWSEHVRPGWVRVWTTVKPLSASALKLKGVGVEFFCSNR